MGIDTVRAHIAPALVRYEMAPLAGSRLPTHRGRYPGSEPGRGLSAGSTGLNDVHDAAEEIDGKRFGHQGRPPSPAPK